MPLTYLIFIPQWKKYLLQVEVAQFGVYDAEMKKHDCQILNTQMAWKIPLGWLKIFLWIMIYSLDHID